MLLTGHFHPTARCYWSFRCHCTYTKIPNSRQTTSSPTDAETDPFCKRISKQLSDRKVPQHETELFTHVRGLLYKHITHSGQMFLALGIPESWKYIVLVEAYNKLGHQGNTHTYCLIKCQYYWKGMNEDIKKYIANCTLFCREKAKVQAYPLQMMEIPRQTIWQNQP